VLDRWARSLGLSISSDRARLAGTLTALTDLLNGGNPHPSESEPRAERWAELLALRATLVEVAHERLLSLTVEESIALHRALDELLVQEVSRAKVSPESLDEPSFHDRFLALLGHDLRNPISAVKLATSILSRDTQSPEARRRTLQRVTSNTDRLLRTLEDSLDYSRLYRGKELALDSARIDLDATSRGVLSALESAYPTRSFAYESPGVIECVIDKERFTRLLSNLLVVAVEHAAPDRETRLRLERGDAIRIHVECPGFEISGPELEQLFESPLGPRRDKARPRGFGVGLFVGERALAQQGGSLRGTPLSPSGTRFVITLPLVPAFAHDVTG
jgi:signal transduction histidine kinase